MVSVEDYPAHEEAPVPAFPSSEWVDAYCRALAAHPGAPRMAAALQGRYRFVIEPAGALEETHRYDLVISTSDGAVDVRQAQGEGTPRLTIRAGYNRWVQLLRGELDIKMGLVLRRIKLSGDVAALTRGLDDAQPLLDALHTVDSELV